MNQQELKSLLKMFFVDDTGTIHDIVNKSDLNDIAISKMKEAVIDKGVLAMVQKDLNGKDVYYYVLTQAGKDLLK